MLMSVVMNNAWTKAVGMLEGAMYTKDLLWAAAGLLDPECKGETT